MDPWGIPQIMRVVSEKLFSTCTVKILLDRSHSNHFVTSLEKPIHFIYSISILWSIVSKAFCKLIKIIPVNNPKSNAFATSSCRYERQESVELNFRKPDWNLYKLFFLVTNSIVWSWMTFSRIFQITGSKEIVL